MLSLSSPLTYSLSKIILSIYLCNFLPAILCKKDRNFSFYLFSLSENSIFLFVQADNEAEAEMFQN